MSQKWRLAVSRCCGDSAAFVRRLRGQSLCRSSCHWFSLALTTAMPHSPASQIGWWTDCGPCSTRLIYASRWTKHVTPLLRNLHWLRYPDRIDYKLAGLVYRCLQGLAPSYLADEFTRVSEIESRRNLLSASTANLVVPRFQRKTLGGRAFPVAAAQAWNSLPSHHLPRWRHSNATSRVKTELFLRSYVQAWYRLMLHVAFLTLLRALEVNIDLRHVNHIRYYYYYMTTLSEPWVNGKSLVCVFLIFLPPLLWHYWPYHSSTST